MGWAPFVIGQGGSGPGGSGSGGARPTWQWPRGHCGFGPRVRAHPSERSPAGRDEDARAPMAGLAGAARGHGGWWRGVAPVRSEWRGGAGAVARPRE